MKENLAADLPVQPVPQKPSTSTPQITKRSKSLEGRQKIDLNLSVQPSPHRRKTQAKKKTLKDIEDQRKKVRDRVKKYRSKLTAEQLEKKREYDRNYKLKRKTEGTWKTVQDMTEREKRKERKLVRERVRKWRMKQQQKNQNDLVEGTCKNKSPIISAQKLTAKNKKNKNNSKSYRDLKKTQVKLKKAEKLAAKYKKRLQRLKDTSQNSPSPTKRVTALAGGRKVPTPIKRRLVFLECVNKGLENKRKELLKTGSKQDLKTFHKTICSPALRSKRVIGVAKNLVGSYKTYKRGSNAIQRKTENRRKLKKETIILVKKFYCEDINSKQLPGKKDYITRQKVSKQKRLLIHPLKDLCKKYNKEHPNNPVSYSSFRALRPFWVVFPQLKDLETCCCIICSNMKLIHAKSKREGLIDLSLEDMITKSVCKENRQNCMLNLCIRCKDNCQIEMTTNDKDSIVVHEEWKSSTRQINPDKTIKIVLKEKVSSTKQELSNLMMDKFIAYKAHVCKIRHQFTELDLLKKSLQPNECLINIDFSENYLCKMNEEIQSCHFGGSKRQISLHTVVLYTKDEIKSYCTVSEDTDHKADAVWAHLDPIFNQISELYPNIDTVHIKSDGPSSQYKNRYNLFLITQINASYPKIKFLTWNFSVAGHGKGPSDGIGGVIKRTADKIVQYGEDITDVDTLIEKVSPKVLKVTLIKVTSDKIQDLKKKRPKEVSSVVGITKVLQVCWTTSRPKTLSLRALSCFSCGYDKECDHNSLGITTLTASYEDNCILFTFIKLVAFQLSNRININNC